MCCSSWAWRNTSRVWCSSALREVGEHDAGLRVPDPVGEVGEEGVCCFGQLHRVRRRRRQTRDGLREQGAPAAGLGPVGVVIERGHGRERGEQFRHLPVPDESGRGALGVDGEHLPHLRDRGDLLPEGSRHDQLLLLAVVAGCRGDAGHAADLERGAHGDHTRVFPHDYGSAAARSAIDRMPIAFSRFSSREAMPHSSETGSRSISCCRSSAAKSGHTHTPSNGAAFLAHLIASFAVVRVFATPTQTGTPTSLARVSLISRAQVASHRVAARCAGGR